VYFYLIKFYSEHNTHGPTSVSMWRKLHCYSTGLIYVFIGLCILLYFYYFISTSFVSGIYAHNAMPKKISTKCNVFLQLTILRPHPHFTRHVRKKNPQNHPHFTRLKIRRSADPQIRILPGACSHAERLCSPYCNSNYSPKKVLLKVTTITAITVNIY